MPTLGTKSCVNTSPQIERIKNPHGDVKIGVFRLQNEVLSGRFSRNGDNLRSIWVDASRTALPTGQIWTRSGTDAREMATGPRIEKPHEDTGFTVFKLESEVVSATFLRKARTHNWPKATADGADVADKNWPGLFGAVGGRLSVRFDS